MQDRQFLANLKLLLRQGVKVFEEHEQQTMALGGQTLIETLLRVPALVREYYAGIAAGMTVVGVGQLLTVPDPTAITSEIRRRSAAEIRRTRAEFELPGHGMVVNRGEMDPTEPESPTVAR